MVRLQIVLLIYMVVGVVAHKMNVINDRGRDGLSNLVVTVFLPFSVLYGFLNDISLEVIRSSFSVVLAAVLSQIISILFSKILYRKQPLSRKCMLEYSTSDSNYSFLGLPCAEAAFGVDGYYLAAVSQVVYRLYLWGVSSPRVIRAEHPEKTIHWYEFFENPCIIALCLGVLYILLPFTLPQPVIMAVKGLSGCATPLCMFIVGYVILDIDWKNSPYGLLILYCLLRLIVIAGTVYGALRLLPLPSLVRNVTVLIAAMPAPSTAAIFAEKYKQDSNFTAQFVFMSTTLSFVTVPLVVKALQLLP